jgi:hypothetical protein
MGRYSSIYPQNTQMQNTQIWGDHVAVRLSFVTKIFSSNPGACYKTFEAQLQAHLRPQTRLLSLLIGESQMNIKNFVIVTLILSMVSAAGADGWFAASAANLLIDKTTATSQTVGQPKDSADTQKINYERQIAKKLAAGDFAWIDQEAARVRANKERFPGGYWKLRILYSAIERPTPERASMAGEWENLIDQLSKWSKKRPQSITARVALATAWQQYAWKVRGGGYAGSVSATQWKTFGERLDRAAEILAEASSLKERCPHWYVTAIWVGIGQQWEREALDRVFETGIKLEPAYYYLYQVKASYLLPQWGGGEGEWERFAEDSAISVGGDQGNIVFFAIYSQVLSIDGITFINNHGLHAIPKLIAGFRSIEKLYGSAPHRLNEACFFATFGDDLATANELYDRIGEDYDKSVWVDKRNFDIFRSSVRQRAKARQKQSNNSSSPSSRTSP